MSTTPKDIFEKDFDYYSSDIYGEYQSTKVNGLQFIFGKELGYNYIEETDCRSKYKRGPIFGDYDLPETMRELSWIATEIRTEYPEANYTLTKEALHIIAYAKLCLSFLKTTVIFDALADPHTALDFFKYQIGIENENQDAKTAYNHWKLAFKKSRENNLEKSGMGNHILTKVFYDRDKRADVQDRKWLLMTMSNVQHVFCKLSNYNIGHHFLERKLFTLPNFEFKEFSELEDHIELLALREDILLSKEEVKMIIDSWILLGSMDIEKIFNSLSEEYKIPSR